MQSTLLFQETNRSLQILDNFMNWGMQQMHAPLTLLELACGLVAENIEDINEVVRQNAAAVATAMTAGATGNGGGGLLGAVAGGVGNPLLPPANPGRGHVLEEEGIVGTALANPNAAADLLALSSTLEARSAVSLASCFTCDALALADNITDLYHFDQGRVLLIETESVKVRGACLEVLEKVPVPSGPGTSAVDLALDIREKGTGVDDDESGHLEAQPGVAVELCCRCGQEHATMTVTRGNVILSFSDFAMERGRRGGNLACKISMFYTNPPDASEAGAAGIMGSAVRGSWEAEFTSAYASWGGGGEPSALDIGSGDNVGSDHGGLRGGHDARELCYSKPSDKVVKTSQAFPARYQAVQDGSMTMMRHTRLHESIQSRMTGRCQDKLRLGLRLLYHLVGAQGSDLRYGIVTEFTSSEATSTPGGVVLPSMTKFWFLLPMSLDFSDRLSVEHILKYDPLQASGNWRVLLNALVTARSLMSSAFLLAPDDIGMSAGIDQQHQQQQSRRQQQLQQQQQHQQQPPQKRPRLHSGSLDPANNILGANMVGVTALKNASVYNQPDTSTSAKSEPAPSSRAAFAPPARCYPIVAPGAQPLVLQKLSCTSYCAENGKVAAKMLRSAPAPNMYSLILMDLYMPVMDGFKATRIIKGSNASNIPVVALTGKTSEKY
ncbi:hypothetical protein ACHAWF_018440 [Thalassiosira exigua]